MMGALFAEKKNTECPNGHSVFLAERLERKSNLSNPTLDDFELVEFNPHEIKPLVKLEFIFLTNL